MRATTAVAVTAALLCNHPKPTEEAMQQTENKFLLLVFLVHHSNNFK